jgi:hypothetical protein
MAASYRQARQLMVIEQKSVTGVCMMIGYSNVMKAAAAGAAALLIIAPASAAQKSKQTTTEILKRQAPKKNSIALFCR